MDIMLERIIEAMGRNHGAKKELADALGISSNNITSWLSGRTSSYTKYASKIADHYNVSLDWLCGKTDVKEKHPDDEIGALSAEENIMLAMYRCVPKDQRKTLRAMIEAALKSEGLL